MFIRSQFLIVNPSSGDSSSDRLFIVSVFVFSLHIPTNGDLSLFIALIIFLLNIPFHGLLPVHIPVTLCRDWQHRIPIVKPPQLQLRRFEPPSLQKLILQLDKMRVSLHHVNLSVLLSTRAIPYLWLVQQVIKDRTVKPGRTEKHIAPKAIFMGLLCLFEMRGVHDLALPGQHTVHIVEVPELCVGSVDVFVTAV